MVTSATRELYSHLTESVQARIVADVLARMRSPEFVRNPVMYMQEWTTQRGHSEELRIPEDCSRKVIEHVVASWCKAKSDALL